MKVYIKHNPKDLTIIVYSVFMGVVHKHTYNTLGKLIDYEELHAYCPLCKNLVSCNIDKMCSAKCLGRCDYFETE